LLLLFVKSAEVCRRDRRSVAAGEKKNVANSPTDRPRARNNLIRRTAREKTWKLVRDDDVLGWDEKFAVLCWLKYAVGRIAETRFRPSEMVAPFKFRRKRLAINRENNAPKRNIAFRMRAVQF